MTDTPAPSSHLAPLRHSRWLGPVGLLLCIALGALYFVTRTEVHTFDALSYTWNLEAKPLAQLFHPHHLLYGPAGWLAYRGSQLLGYVGRADVPVQALNAIAGAFGVFAFWRFGTRWSGRGAAALAVAALLGVTWAYWVYAAEVEVYTLATAFLSLTLWLLAMLDERPRPAVAALAGVAHAGAIMFHQTNVLFGFAVMTLLLLRRPLRRPAIIGAYLIAGSVATLLPYALVGVISRFPDVNGYWRWLTDYAASGQWGGFLSLTHWPALRAGLQNSITPNALLATLFYALVAVATAVAVWRARRSAPRRAWLALAAVWLLTYGAFFWWWEPWNIEFWIAVLPLWGFLLLAALPERVGDPVDRRVGAVALVPAVLAGALLAHHLAPIQAAGDAGTDFYRQMTTALQSVVEPDDLIVTRGNILDLYIPFYADHPHVLSLRQLEQESGGDRARVMGALQGQLDWAVVTGRPFMIDALVLDETRDAIRHPFGLSADEIAHVRQRYTLDEVVQLDGRTVFYGSPRVASFGRTGWTFDGTLDGWQAWGIDAPRFEGDGWCFDGGIDPQLKGPPTGVDAGAWTTVRLDITLVNAAEGDEAQLFWHGPGETYALENSLRIPLQSGRDQYTASLAGAPAWSGTIERLRLDPVRGSDETGAPGPTVCVHAVELLP